MTCRVAAGSSRTSHGYGAKRPAADLSSHRGPVAPASRSAAVLHSDSARGPPMMGPAVGPVDRAATAVESSRSVEIPTDSRHQETRISRFHPERSWVRARGPAPAGSDPPAGYHPLPSRRRAVCPGARSERPSSVSIGGTRRCVIPVTRPRANRFRGPDCRRNPRPKPSNSIRRPTGPPDFPLRPLESRGGPTRGHPSRSDPAGGVLRSEECDRR